MYSCIIIDDDQYSLNGLRGYIESVPYLELVQSYTDSIKALCINDRAPVDIIFMDIEMPKINGIELSKIIRNKTKKLVFTTAHTKYAYEAFEVEANGYLLKPYTMAKFLTLVNKIFSEENIRLDVPESNQFFFVKSRNEDLKIIKIRYEDIVAVESKLNYILIHTLHRQVLTYMSLTEAAKILGAAKNFVQLHRSYIIAENHIEMINGNTIMMSNGLELVFGEVYRKKFNIFITDHLINAGKRK